MLPLDDQRDSRTELISRGPGPIVRLMWWWLRIDDAEWPDGEAWPRGQPPLVGREARRTRPVIVSSAVMVVPMMFAFTAIGIQDEAAVAAAIGVSSLVSGLYIARQILWEARRQGWGSNIWPPVN